MTRVVRLLAVAGLLVASFGSASAQPRRRRPPEPPPAPAPVPLPDIRVRSELTQTAAWVGDPVDFVVEIDMAPGVEVVADDLKPEKLTVEGLELGGTTSSIEARADGWRTLRHRYRVTPWDTTPPKRVGNFVVRFRRPVTTATADGTAPAAELKVTGATLSMRSTLPDDGSANGARDRQSALTGPVWVQWLRPIGLGFIALGAAPVVLWFAARARRPRVTRPRPSSRSLQAQAKGLFDELQIIDTSSVDGRRRAYDRIDHTVRAYLAQAEGVPAQALTAEELRGKLASARRVRGDAVCDVLAACEHARYSPDDRLPDAGELGETIAHLRGALER
jgi:hypothetical protein